MFKETQGCCPASDPCRAHLHQRIKTLEVDNYQLAAENKELRRCLKELNRPK